MDPRLGTALIVVIGVPAVLIGYIYATEIALRLVPESRAGKVRPWLWLAPALAFVGVFLIYPTIGTIIRSFQDKAGTAVRRIRQLRLVLRQSRSPRVPPQQRPVGPPADRVHGRARHGDCAAR